MTNITLAQSLIKKATDRVDILDLLLNKGAYSDVMREAQERKGAFFLRRDRLHPNRGIHG